MENTSCVAGGELEGACDAGAEGECEGACDAGAECAGCEGEAGACKAFCCAKSVVDATGQPSPGPFRFWRVSIAAWTRAAFEAVLLSAGKDTFSEGLCTAWPAATFSFSA